MSWSAVLAGAGLLVVRTAVAAVVSLPVRYDCSRTDRRRCRCSFCLHGFDCLRLIAALSY